MRSYRLSPFDQHLALTMSGIAFGHFFVGHYDEACSWAKQAEQELPNFLPGLRVLAASSALGGRPTEAQNAALRIRELAPSLRLSDLRNVAPFHRIEDFNMYTDGLRKAGLPE